MTPESSRLAVFMKVVRFRSLRIPVTVDAARRAILPISDARSRRWLKLTEKEQRAAAILGHTPRSWGAFVESHASSELQLTPRRPRTGAAGGQGQGQPTELGSAAEREAA